MVIVAIPSAQREIPDCRMAVYSHTMASPSSGRRVEPCIAAASPCEATMRFEY
jgi:hypothetical protein